MGLKSLTIQGFRNLQSASIEADPGLNLITGDNAAGKTSLLESIFYLSYGRSFRTHQVKHLINRDADFFRLVSVLDDQSLLGLERTLNDQTIRHNQQNISRVSQLSSLLPVLALHPDSHQLISAGPEYRRQFIDWGVFHVEHKFMSIWKTYRTALSQRNAALRKQLNNKMCILWDAQLVQSAELIESMRLEYLSLLQPKVSELADVLFPGFSIDIKYQRGWSRDLDYAAYLSSHLHQDRERGFTQSGPHRADLKILLNDQPAQTSISRGQQKLLVCLLKIAQLNLFTERAGERCVLLFDDLPAELDSENQNKIMSILSSLDVQVFITAIESSQIQVDFWSSHKVFHVEHGLLEQLPEDNQSV